MVWFGWGKRVATPRDSMGRLLMAFENGGWLSVWLGGGLAGLGGLGGLGGQLDRLGETICFQACFQLGGGDELGEITATVGPSST